MNIQKIVTILQICKNQNQSHPSLIQAACLDFIRAFDDYTDKLLAQEQSDTDLIMHGPGPQ